MSCSTEEGNGYNKQGVHIKSVLIGSVLSSRVVLEELIEAGCPPEMVFSLDEAVSVNVSGYYPIHETAQTHGIPWQKFRKIADHAEAIAALGADYIFVVGLSQIVGKPILKAAKCGSDVFFRQIGSGKQFFFL